MQAKPVVMIVDTDRSRRKALRRILKGASVDVKIEEVHKVSHSREAILKGRPTLVLLHSAFPYIEDDGTGLFEFIKEDFRNSRIGLMLVLPISGSLLYRSGYQEGSEILDLADDLITTDFTSDMIQSIVGEYIERRVAAEAPVAEEVHVGEFTLASSK